MKKNSKAPNFSLPSTSSENYFLKDSLGKYVVLYFYPKDDTPGCTAENCGFRDKYDLFKLFGAEVWGVSGDDEASHRSFADKNKLPFPLLCDTDNSLRRAFGVPKVLGLLDGRVTYIIDSKGVIRHIFNDLLNGPAHVNEALRVLGEIRN